MKMPRQPATIADPMENDKPPRPRLAGRGCLTIFAAMFLLLVPRFIKAADRPNVVIILADDKSHDPIRSAAEVSGNTENVTY